MIKILPAVSVFAGIALALPFWKLLHRYYTTPLYTAQMLSVPTKLVLGSSFDCRGDKNAPYSLVEFADYQCVPCRAVNTQVAAILNSYKNKVRFTFRNYPLPFHAQAMPAALAAEAARRQGKFWSMHDALYEHQQTLGKAQIEAIADTLKLDKRRFLQDSEGISHQVVADDIKVANSIKVHGTPTFVLCCPDGRVVSLGALDEIKQYVH